MFAQVDYRSDTVLWNPFLLLFIDSVFLAYSFSILADPTSGRLCADLLPSTTLPSVVSFYKALETGEISDISTMPAPVGRKVKKIAKSDPAPASGDKADKKEESVATEATAIADASASVATAKQYWETTTAGRVWFDLCSERPGVGYLSSTSDQRRYELQPNMINVCAALRVLLGAAADPSTSEQTAPKVSAKSANTSAPDVSAASQSLWKLDALERFWNTHVLQLTSLSKHCPLRPIRTTESTLRFRAPFSDTETITRELGSIQFVGGRNAIDIELESAHQLATVKHRLCVDPTMRLWNVQARAPYASYIATSTAIAAPKSGGSDVTKEVAAVAGVACSAVLGDALLKTLLKDIQQAVSTASKGGHAELSSPSSQRDRRIVQALMATRWGEERRQGSDNKDTDEDAAPMSVTDVSLTTADAKRQVESAVNMSVQALRLVSHCHDVTLLTQLVAWMLQEAPPQLSFDALATTFLSSYSPQVRGSPAFQAMIQTHLGTDNEEGVLFCRMINIGTEKCPSKNKFGLFDLADILNFRDRIKLFVLYLKNK